jgi:dTDP-4-dehydrorhamnose reductase
MTRPTRVLVTGANGQLGQALARAEWPAAISPIFRTRTEFDVSCQPEVDALLATAGIDVVVNAAAYTAVDQAEDEIAKAYAVNHHGPHNLAAACARSGAALIHVSTDYVFDGTKTEPYVETDPIAPVNAYGRSKAAGEDAVRSALVRHVILRTAWLYGTDGKNFVRTILRLAGERDSLSVVADQVGNPTAAADLADAIIAILGRLHEGGRGRDAIAWGTYHCVNSGDATWHALADAVVERAAPVIGKRPPVRAISSAAYPTRAARPANSRLATKKLQSAFGIRMRPWDEALTPVVADLVRR